MSNSIELKSEVEINKELLQDGDVLFYIDDANSETWTVLSILKVNIHGKIIRYGFIAIDNDGYKKQFAFSQLQKGWSISETTKKAHAYLFGFIYK